MQKCNPEDFLDLFQRVVHKYNQFEGQKRYYGTDILITVSEIHTIDAIGNQGSINLTNLAAHMGITKGSASQMIYKLVDKELVVKQVAPNSDREIVISLSEKGKQAYQGHKEMHLNSNGKMNSIVMDMPQDVLSLSKTYMERFEKVLDLFLEEEI